jgi:S1-C subfamily serine protease
VIPFRGETTTPATGASQLHIRACGSLGIVSTVMVAALLFAHPGHAAPSIEQSVVKVFSTQRSPDAMRPWNRQVPREASGSGVIIEGKRILTNAHVVLYAAQVQVQSSEQGDKVAARVVAISPGMDLAVLQLDDETFFAGRPAVARSSVLPAIKDTVLSYGYPMGGTSMSITKGIVSRVEFVPYRFPVSGLRIQTDAPLNPGNSGGPVFAGDKMIGLAFAGIGGAQSIGYIIPNEEIELFLRDVATGPYRGKWGLHDEFQSLENPALREKLKLDKTVTGVVVRAPYRSDAAYPLKEWDIVTRIGDIPLDNQGTTRLGVNQRVNFRYHVQRLVKNGKVPLTILRGGQLQQIEVPADADRRLLVSELQGEHPPYFIYGPLAFSIASTQLAAAVSGAGGGANINAFNGSPIITQRGDPPSADREHLVVVSAPYFPHPLVKGYDSRVGSVVQSVNDQPIRSLAHLVETLRDLKDDFVTIRFDQRNAETLVFSRSAMLEATDAILGENEVRSQGSTDMMAVWSKKAPTAVAASAAPGTVP